MDKPHHFYINSDTNYKIIPVRHMFTVTVISTNTIHVHYANCTVPYIKQDGTRVASVYFVYDTGYYLPENSKLLRYVGNDPHTEDIVKCRIQVYVDHIGIDGINHHQLEQWCNALSRWERSNVSHYMYDIRWDRFRISNEYVTIHVTDRKNIYYNNTIQQHEHQDVYGTIEDLFTYIFDSITLEYDSLKITYDAIFGYPQYGTIDKVKDIADEEVSFKIQNFQHHTSSSISTPDEYNTESDDSISSSSTVVVLIILIILILLLVGTSIFWWRRRHIDQ